MWVVGAFMILNYNLYDVKKY